MNENRTELTGNELLLITGDINKHQEAHHKYYCRSNQQILEMQHSSINTRQVKKKNRTHTTGKKIKEKIYNENNILCISRNVLIT